MLITVHNETSGHLANWISVSKSSLGILHLGVWEPSFLGLQNPTFNTWKPLYYGQEILRLGVWEF